MKKIVFSLLLIVVLSTSFLFYKEQKTPAVSVIMPIYNRPDLAPRAIESILNQTMTDFEFVIVDDGSNEETKKVLKEYAKKDSRIRLFHNRKNKGIAYSRQRALDAARGTYVATMDSDDWSVPDRLEKSLAFMLDHPDVDVLSGSAGSIKEGEFIPKYTIENPSEYTISKLPGFYEVELMFYNILPNASSFYRRDFVKEKHIKHDLKLMSAEDYDFWRQFVVNGGSIASVSDVLVYIRSHNTNSPKYYDAMHQNSLDIHEKFFSLFFTPSSDELKFEYSIKEKCTLLHKMKEANLKKARIPQVYLENRYKELCPVDLANAYYLVNGLNGWEGFIEKKDENTWVRIATNDTGRLVKIGEDKIEMHWNGYPMEAFVKQNGDWQYVLSGEEISLKHKNWSDGFIVVNGNKGCRVNVKTECAKIKKNDDNTIWVDWKNTAWASEEFKKNAQGVYEFIRELDEKEQI